MRRVISILLILMQLLFFINYFLNEGVMFFNLYLWAFTAIFGIMMGIRSWRNGSYLYENHFLYKATYLILFIISILSMLFIFYLLITRPYLL